MIETLIGLQNDHRNLARLANLLASRAALPAQPDRMALALLVDAVYYLTHYPDIHHHPREDALAAWLQQQGALPQATVATLTEQHATLAVQGRDLLRDLESLMRAETETWPGLAPRLRAYAELLRLNMATEEADLLPIAFAEMLDAGSVPLDLAASDIGDPLDEQAEARFTQLRAVIIAEAQCDCEGRPTVTCQPIPGEHPS